MPIPKSSIFLSHPPHPHIYGDQVPYCLCKNFPCHSGKSGLVPLAWVVHGEQFQAPLFGLHADIDHEVHHTDFLSSTLKLDLQQKRWTYRENGGLTRKKVDLQRNDPPYRPKKWTYRPKKCPYNGFSFQFETKRQENKPLSLLFRPERLFLCIV
jgi:hypothetical protein